ncbi:hypothetical protein HYT55_03520 [Candidatus Woesearchaeota archaeon]|nr:hypothetical protein [Candidatus Woesearchaeota archaeon]
MHFYESSIITTKDGLQCQVYGNEHPSSSILVKPKYIPTSTVESSALAYRFIMGRKMNRLNMWAEKEELKSYIARFREAYSSYVYTSPFHDKNHLFFSIPIDKIERIYFPRRGFKELMSMPPASLDQYLFRVFSFSQFLLQSGLRIKDFGITYSTLMGHYNPAISDINIVVYGKENFWKLMSYLESATHPFLHWKTDEEWLAFHKKRNRFSISQEKEFLHSMKRRKTEGYFDGSLFVIFAAEKEEEVWFKWGEEKYTSVGQAVIEGEVVDNFSSVVRPGCYNIKNSTIIENDPQVALIPISKIVFYSRDYCMLAYPGERIRASGIVEHVQMKSGEAYYRLVVGYFDAYLDERREKEYIKLIS